MSQLIRKIFIRYDFSASVLNSNRAATPDILQFDGSSSFRLPESASMLSLVPTQSCSKILKQWWNL